MIRPSPSGAAARNTMVANRHRDTSAELAVRRLLHANGFRYRVDYALLGWARRRCDVAFPRDRVAVFIDGCFWHRCPDHYVAPSTNAEFWHRKTLRTTERDVESAAYLRELGWSVLRYWEHEDPATVAADIKANIFRWRSTE